MTTIKLEQATNFLDQERYLKRIREAGIPVTPETTEIRSEELSPKQKDAFVLIQRAAVRDGTIDVLSAPEAKAIDLSGRFLYIFRTKEKDTSALAQGFADKIAALAEALGASNPSAESVMNAVHEADASLKELNSNNAVAHASVFSLRAIERAYARLRDKLPLLNGVTFTFSRKQDIKFAEAYSRELDALTTFGRKVLAPVGGAAVAKHADVAIKATVTHEKSMTMEGSKTTWYLYEVGIRHAGF